MSQASLDTHIKQVNQLGDLHAPTFKQAIAANYQWLEAALVAEPIEQLIVGRAAFIDALVSRIWQLNQLEQQAAIALVAVGGYGRGQLQPYSDVDLLILSQAPLTEQQQQQVSDFIRFCWDIGLEVGQAVRTIAQAIELGKNEITIATNMLEARLLIGCQDTFQQMQQAVQATDFWPSQRFFAAKLAEQQQRHQKFHGTAYNLEPNIKENPGCLRDIQSIGWVAKKHFQAFTGKELVEHGYFTQSELDELIECRNHLWRMRAALHLCAGRSENRLLFDYQSAVAERLGFGNDGKKAVEAMMKGFFRQVWRISELNQMLMQRFEQEILPNTTHQLQSINDDFELADGLLQPRHERVFSSPEAILDCLLLLANTPQAKGISADTLRQLRNARCAFAAQYFVERQACRSRFMTLMRHPDCFGLAWDIMYQHGILHAYLPEWDHIAGMMQFDLFHAYTVDEHTHRLVKLVQQYSLPENSRFPRCQRIVRNLDKPELLFIAAIFHDIGKGRGGDHAVLGAQDAAQFCQQHDLSEQDAAMIVWLVENHLLMSTVAQRRDIYDPQVVNDFTARVKTQAHLDQLYALTLADIRATNDNLWNDWKASLLRELYLFTQKALANGLECQASMQERSQQHRQQAREMLLEQGIDDHQLQGFWQRLESDYFVRFNPRQIAWHARQILPALHDEQSNILVAINAETSKSGTELLLYGPDRIALFAQVASVLDSLHCSIHDANLITQDSMVFDSFMLLESDGSPIDQPRRLQQLQRAISTQLNKAGDQHRNNRRMSRRMRQLEKQLNIACKVRFFAGPRGLTLMELEALDFPGLLATIGRALVEQNVSLHMAKITTIGERAEDVFMLSTLDGQALSVEQEVALRNHLTHKLEQVSN